MRRRATRCTSRSTWTRCGGDRAAGFATLGVQSAAPDRQHYLRRPDLGRKLSDEGRALLAAHGDAVTGDAA